MASFAKALFVVLAILVAACAAYRYAWYSGPYVLALQRKTGLWGTRLFNGAYPQGIDFDALSGLRLAWLQLSDEARTVRRDQIVAALDRYSCAADAHLNRAGSVERLFRTPHRLVGALNALAELDLLHRTLTGAPKLETSRPLRSALTEVAWQ